MLRLIGGAATALKRSASEVATYVTLVADEAMVTISAAFEQK